MSGSTQTPESIAGQRPTVRSRLSSFFPALRARFVTPPPCSSPPCGFLKGLGYRLALAARTWRPPHSHRLPAPWPLLALPHWPLRSVPPTIGRVSMGKAMFTIIAGMAELETRALLYPRTRHRWIELRSNPRHQKREARGATAPYLPPRRGRASAAGTR
jgi:hypothetical protein